ncbi:MAG: phosphocholine cytidylyltransferase family protein [bacterium]|nr:phosphocholine cytidylyltransferase family protein [bacterium]
MNNNIITAIILAAGMGTRLHPLTNTVPKPLVEVAGKPLLAYTIGFARRAGANRIIAVTGHQADLVERVARGIDKDITFFYNEHYRNKKSLHAAGIFNQVDGDFLLMNADHIYRLSVAERVRNQMGNGIVAFTDTDRELGDDDMKVESDDSGAHIRNIAKGLKRFSHGYVGMTYCQAEYLPRYRQAAASAQKRYGDAGVLECVLQELAGQGERIRLGDISGHGWHEVDFPEEKDIAEAAVRANPDLYA